MKKPAKRTLVERILNPAKELKSASDPKVRLGRTLFLWSKGAHAGQLLEFAPEMIDFATPQERLILAAILLESGRMTEATTLAAETYTASPGLIERLRYPALTLALSRMQPAVVAGLPKEIAALESFARQPDYFAQLLRENATSIAVVGNGPTLLETQQGSEIDDHAVVIRFNNFQTLPDHQASTGTRTNIWFRTLYADWLWRRDRLNCDLTLIAGQAAYYRMINTQDILLEQDLRGQKTDFIPHSVYHNLRQHYQIGAPSTGLLCLYWLHCVLGGLDGVDLYGFRLIDQPKGKSVEYFNQGHPGKPHPHDWTGEHRALCALHPGHFGTAPKSDMGPNPEGPARSK